MWGMSERTARTRVRTLISQIKDKLHIEGSFRYNGINDPVAELLQVKVKHGSLPRDYGKYFPDSPDGSSIVLDTSKQGSEKLNFTFFHEITHHIIRQDDDLYSWINEPSNVQDVNKLIERLCDVGAAEFLLPLSKVREAIQNHSFTIQLIPVLEDMFFASKPVILIQLIECATHSCYGVICNYGQIPSDFVRKETDIGEECLYVEFSTGSFSTKHTIGKYGTIEKEHIIFDAYKLQSFIKGKARIPFRNRNPWKEDAEALYHKGKVYALFNLNEPAKNSPDQLSLFSI